LLKGLEISERKVSELERTLRIDSEFFQRKHLDIESKLKRNHCDTVAVVAKVSDGNHFSISDSFEDDGLPYFRGQDVVGHFFIEQAHPNRISRLAFEQKYMRRSHLKKGDVLLSIVGTIGEASLVMTEQEATCSCKLAILRPHEINPAYLATFLTSSIGRALTERWKRGAVQMGLILEDMDQFPVPRFSTQFEKSVGEIVRSAFLAQGASLQALHDAETSLLSTLQLEHWQAPEPLSYIRSSRDAFGVGRLDAQYFHPAKTDALTKLSALSDSTVGDHFNSVSDLWQPDDDSGPDIVRNYDLSDALSPFLDGSKEPSERTIIASTKKVIQSGDLAVSRLRSYLREIALVQPGDGLPMVASTEFIVLRPKEVGGVPVEVLMIFLRSALPQIVFKWSQDGSNHPRFDEKELLRLPLPEVLIQHSSDYVKAVRSVIAKRERANQLLDAAKRAVEIAVEQDEKAAQAFLKVNV
jgi:type I restriction enzyme, S subunit